ncbi:G2 and S phase-expressed protein 1 isoform X2 [Stigmatopora argus]
MEHRANSDVIFLMDEKFDFDVSLSPDSSMSDKDKDDVFLDMSHHMIEPMPNKLVSCLEQGSGEARVRWSPLSGDQLEIVCQEAKRLADRLQRGKGPSGEEEAAAQESPSLVEADKESFIQDATAKLNVLATPLRHCSPVKRQTFLVQDSPMKDLPPAFQERLRRASAAPSSGSSAAPATRAFTRLSTANPAGSVKTRAPLRGKAGLGGVLPSKPTVPRTLSSVSKGADPLKIKVQRPNKVVSSYKPSLDFAGRTKSCTDIVSVSPSVVSDMSNSSHNSNAVGKKRTLAPPTKVVRRKSGIVVAPIQSRKTTERHNTSSSSSSVSSFNSSLSLSPSAGKMNSSGNQCLRSSTNPVAPGGVSRPANQSKRRSSKGGATTVVERTMTPLSSANSKYRKLSEPVKGLRTPTQRQITPAKTSLDKTLGAPINASMLTPSGRSIKRHSTTLDQMVASSGKASGQGFCSPDLSKVLRPKRLVSVACMEGLSQMHGLQSPPIGVTRPMQLHSQRPSGLPTPVKRQTAAHTLGSHPRASKSSRKQVTRDFDGPSGTSPSPAPGDSNGPDLVEIQPFCLEDQPPANPSGPNSLEREEQPPVQPSAANSSECEEQPPSNPSGPNSPETKEQPPSNPSGPNSPETEERPGHCPPEPSKEAIIPPESATQEVLLLDLPVLTPQPVEKLLIDLSNTPDLIRNNSKTCAGTQLIDLSSPLIKWSPEDKKENSAPLINLSF